MTDLLGVTLDEVLAANPVFAGAPENVRTAFARYFEPWAVPDGVLFDRDDPARPPPDALILLGGHSTLLLTWRSGTYKATSFAYYADTLGAESVAPPQDPPVAPSLWSATSMAKGAIAWRMPFGRIPEIATEIGQDATDELLLRLARTAWLAPAPAVARTLNVDRMALANRMGVRAIQAGEVLLDTNWRLPTGLFGLMPGAEVRVDRTRADGTTVSYLLGFGAIFAHVPAQRAAEPQRVVVTATVASSSLYLPRRALARIRLNPFNTERGEMRELLSEIQERSVNADAVVKSLKRSPLFLAISEPDLYPLVEAAACSLWRPRFTPPGPFGDQTGVAAVLRGELLSYRMTVPAEHVEYAPGSGHLHTLGHYGAYDVIGDRDMVLGFPHSSHWMARLPAQTMFIPETVLNDRLGHLPAYTDARTLMRTAAERDIALRRQRHALGRMRSCAILVGTADGRPWSPLLTALLSAGIRSIKLDFTEESCVLQVLPTGGIPNTAPGWNVAYVDPSGTEEQRIGRIADVVCQKIVEYGDQGISNCFVWVDPTLPGAAALSAVFDRVVFFEPDIHAIERRPLPAGVPLVFVALLPATNAECAGAWYPPSTVRLRVDVARISAAVASDPALALDGAGLHALFPPRQTIDDGLDIGFPEQMSRLARGLTDRRVGIALSGGESWGFGHYAVLGALLYRKIPIDVIAGASVGSVIGGYFCLKGVGGLREFIESRAQVMAISIASMGTSILFMDYLNRAFGGALIEGLDRQLIPVATNLQMSCPEPILDGKVAWGCRLSGSLVPAYPPTPTDHGTFLDGAFADNLPVEALRVEGARLIVASNVMSPSGSTKSRPPLLPGQIGLALADFNPIRRIVSTWEGVLTLAFSAGGASATNADRVFQFDRMDVGLFNLLDSPQIVHRALSQPDLWETLRGVELRWEHLQQPRIIAGKAYVDDVG